MLRELGESRDKETFTNDDVFDKDGVKWSEKYDDMRRRYRDRFFTSGPAVIEAQEEDIEKDACGACSRPCSFVDGMWRE